MERPAKSIEEIVAQDPRYPVDAVNFVRQGLSFTVEQLKPARSDPDKPRHISGAQLCQGLRALALKKWGFMARQVLQNWHITTTRDFGEIVFLLVNHGWMQKEPADRLEDFDGVYDFAEAFDKYYETSLYE